MSILSRTFPRLVEKFYCFKVGRQVTIKYFFIEINNDSITLLAVVSELRRNHCEQTNDFLSSMREDHVMESR